MHQRFKAFFLCLLFVTLPVQSIAGVAMYRCGMTHQSSGASLARHLDDGTSENAAYRERHTNSSKIAVSSTVSAEEECGNMNGRKLSSCGTCAGCCLSSCAPPPFPLLNLVQQFAQVKRSEPIPSLAGPFPARLERPPRAFS